MRCAALIPARGGSRRIPHKNVRPLAGQPLIRYTIEAAKAAGIFDWIIVSSDDDAVRDIAIRSGVCFAARRSEHATDSSPDIDWMADLLERPFGCPALPLRELVDCTMLLRPTSPFRQAATIRRAWAQWLENGAQFDSLRAVEVAKQHPLKMWDLSNGPVLGPMLHPLMPANFFGIGDPNPPAHSRPTQTLPTVYAQNASLEIAHVRTVTELHSISGSRVMPFFTEGYEGVDLNTELDWLVVETIVERGLARLPEIA